MAIRVTTGKTPGPAAKKAPSAAKAVEKPAAKNAARASPGRPISADSLAVKFDNALQRVKERNKELTADLDALLAGLK